MPGARSPGRLRPKNQQALLLYQHLSGRALPLYLWEKCRGRAVQQKIGERYRWGATPLSLAKMQGQGSKKLASATAGGLPLYLWENAGAGQCSKNWRALLGGYPSILQEQGSAVKIWRALPLGGDPCIFVKNMGALIPTNTP